MLSIKIILIEDHFSLKRLSEKYCSMWWLFLFSAYLKNVNFLTQTKFWIEQIFLPTFTQKYLHNNFHQSLEALFDLWKREWTGKLSLSPQPTSIQNRLYRQTLL